MNTFLYVLAILWMVGGIFFLPFNSVICAGLLAAKTGISDEAMWRDLKKIWTVEICWNLLFFYTSLVCRYLMDSNAFTMSDLGYCAILGPIFAAVAVFWLPFTESMIFGTIAFSISRPVTATAVYGGMALQSHFLDRIGSGNKREEGE